MAGLFIVMALTIARGQQSKRRDLVMSNIYDQYKAAFAQVEAYVILRDGERIASIAFKFPKDGAGRLYAYVHWYGLEMVRGHASGGGYDKRSAACSVAARKLPQLPRECTDRVTLGDAYFIDFRRALIEGDNGAGFDRCLRDAGFEMLQAV